MTGSPRRTPEENTKHRYSEQGTRDYDLDLVNPTSTEYYQNEELNQV